MHDEMIRRDFFERYGIRPDRSYYENIDVISARIDKLLEENGSSDEISKCRIAMKLVKDQHFGGELKTAPVSFVTEKGNPPMAYLPVEDCFISGVRLADAGQYPGAKEFLEKASNAGHKSASALLGTLYESGKLGPIDRNRAEALYSIAGEEGKALSGSEKVTEKVVEQIHSNFMELQEIVNAGRDINALERLLAAMGGGTEFDLLTKADFYWHSGEHDKLVYTLSELEKTEPVVANKKLAEFYFFEQRSFDYRKGLQAAEKLQKMKSPEGIFFIGYSRIQGLGQPQNLSKGRSDLLKYIQEMEGRDPDGAFKMNHLMIAKWAVADSIFGVADAESPRTLEQAIGFYKEISEAGEDCYKKINYLNGLIADKKKEKKKTIIKRIVSLCVLAVVLFGIKTFAPVVKAFIPKSQPKETVEKTETAEEVTEEEASAVPSISNYTIRDDVDPRAYANAEVLAATASSILVNDSGTTYVPENLFDDKVTTSWQEGVDGNGEGEYVDISLSGLTQVTAISFSLGNEKSSDRYYNNNRPRKLKLTIGEESEIYEFADAYDTWQTIVFDEPVEMQDIRIELDEVYPGEKWPDTCIAEVKFITDTGI